MIFNMLHKMLMTFLGMKLKVTQNRRRKGRVCRMLPFPLCITVRRLVTIPTAWGNFAYAHIVQLRTGLLYFNGIVLVCSGLNNTG